MGGTIEWLLLMIRASTWQRSAGRRANKAEKRVNGKTVKPCRCREQSVFVRARGGVHFLHRLPASRATKE